MPTRGIHSDVTLLPYLTFSSVKELTQSSNVGHLLRVRGVVVCRSSGAVNKACLPGLVRRYRDKVSAKLGLYSTFLHFPVPSSLNCHSGAGFRSSLQPS